MSSFSMSARSRVQRTIFLASLALVALVAIPANASAHNYGHYSDLCDGTVTPAVQTIDLATGANTAAFTATLTKKADFVQVWNYWTWRYDTVKTWGCLTPADGAPDAPDVPAPNVPVTWTVISGPNIGKTGTGSTGVDGKANFTYNGVTSGDDTVKVSATSHYCDLQNTTLATCPAANVHAEVLSKQIIVHWINALPVPDTAIVSGPTGVTNDNTPTFGLTATIPGSTFKCAIDAAAMATVTTPYTTATLAEGPHTLTCAATSPAGKTDPTPATRTFTVDTVAPDTAIPTGPTGTTNDNTPTFTITGTEVGSTF
ncbi:MAG: hypothetical protein JHC87_01040, partial [Thermoleophilaceae bacterium]|nr:hypothetical protein [Thermoleophilaceae bacterium]